MSEADLPLHPKTQAMLDALRDGTAPSRNAAFELHRDPHVQRAVELHRLLESVVSDVEAYSESLEVSVVDQNRGRYALEVAFPDLMGRRIVYLEHFELQLLSDYAPAIAHLLSNRLDGAPR